MSLVSLRNYWSLIKQQRRFICKKCVWLKGKGSCISINVIRQTLLVCGNAALLIYLFIHLFCFVWSRVSSIFWMTETTKSLSAAPQSPPTLELCIRPLQPKWKPHMLVLGILSFTLEAMKKLGWHRIPIWLLIGSVLFFFFFRSDSSQGDTGPSD